MSERRYKVVALKATEPWQWTVVDSKVTPIRELHRCSTKAGAMHYACEMNKTTVCVVCEEEEAEFVVTVTDMEHVIKEMVHLCAGCYEPIGQHIP